MMRPLPSEEEARLATLRRYAVLDTPAEEGFDDLTAIAAQICEVPMALVSLVDKDRQWFKSRVGVSAVETARDSSFCAHAIMQGDGVFEVADAQADPRFANSELVTGDMGVRFYAGAPLVVPGGEVLGALCVMDRTPRALTPEQQAALRALSRRVVAQMELRRHSQALVTEVAERQRSEAELRRQIELLDAVKREFSQLLVVAERSRRALLGVLEDEKEAQAALRASEERFRGLIENASDVIAVVDQTGCITFQSPSTQRILGHVPEAVAGRNVMDFIHPEDREAAGRGILRALAIPTTSTPVEYRIRHCDGTWRIFQSIGRAMADSRGARLVVVNSRDVTETRALQAQFLRAQRMEAIGTLAGGIAHDLNNILAPILMVAALLKEKIPNPQDRELLTIVEQGAQRGANIIKQLLTFSRGIAGERGPVQVRHLLKDMVSIMRETFPREVTVRENISGDLWPITADATQIHQVLMNLCVNARDAMPAGGTLTLGAQNVTVDEAEVALHPGAKPGPCVRLTVTDTGAGIPRENVDRIFEPFFTTKEMGKGTGLGLSTVSGIVKSHAGFVAVESEIGGGSAFRVYLPANVGAKEIAALGVVPQTVRGRRELILVVDDEAPIRQSLRLILEAKNYRVLVAGDGGEAASLLREHRAEVQLVLTDLMMPGTGGVALVRALRGLEPRLPVVAMSGLHDEDRRAELAALGVTLILAKPCDAREILDAVQSVLAPTAVSAN